MSQGYKESVQEMCAKIDAVTREVRTRSMIKLQLEVLTERQQDIWRVATRILRPSSTTKPLNHGLGSGVPTIVAIGRNLERLGDVKQVLRKWDLGRRA